MRRLRQKLCVLPQTDQSKFRLDQSIARIGIFDVKRFQYMNNEFKHSQGLDNGELNIPKLEWKHDRGSVL